MKASEENYHTLLSEEPGFNKCSGVLAAFNKLANSVAVIAPLV